MAYCHESGWSAELAAVAAAVAFQSFYAKRSNHQIEQVSFQSSYRNFFVEAYYDISSLWQMSAPSSSSRLETYIKLIHKQH